MPAAAALPARHGLSQLLQPYVLSVFPWVLTLDALMVVPAGLVKLDQLAPVGVPAVALEDVPANVLAGVQEGGWVGTLEGVPANVPAGVQEGDWVGTLVVVLVGTLVGVPFDGLTAALHMGADMQDILAI